MAPFNPHVQPTNDPNYLGYSHPISTPEVDKSKGIFLEGLGNMIESGAKVADSTLASLATNEARDKTQAELEGRTVQLELQKAFKGQNVQDPTVMSYAGSEAEGTIPVKATLTQGVEDELPDDVRDRLEGLGVLGSARANGKISPTLYYGRLNSIAKDVRAKYPGYRDAIDREISKISGVDPANAYIKSLTADINSVATGTSSEKNKSLSLLKEYAGQPGVPEMVDKVIAGTAGYSEAFKLIQPWAKIKLDREGMKQRREDDAAGRGVLEKNYADDWETESTRIVTAYFNSLPAPPADPTNSELVAQYGQKVAELKAQAQTHLEMAGNELDKNNNSYAKVLTAPKIKATNDAKMAVFDGTMDRVYNDKSGTVNLAHQLVKSMDANASLSLYRGKDLGWVVRTGKAIENSGLPQAAKEFMNTQLADKDFPLSVNAYLKTQKMDALVSPDPLNPKSMKEMIDQTKKDGMDMGGKSNDELLRLVWGKKGLADPTTPEPMKLAIARGLFNPKNAGLIANIADDYKDAQGNFHPGKYSTWRNLTSPEVLKSTYELGQKYPDVWQNAQNYIETTFGKELLQKEILNLNTLQNQPNIKVTWNDGKDGAMGWGMKIVDGARVVDTHGELSNKVYLGADNRPLIEPGALDNARGTINRLNGGLKTISTLAEYNKMDPSTYLLKTMQGFGLQIDDKNIEGLPAKMVQSIIQSKEEKKKIDTKKKPE